jgi:hypothetical protein
LVQVVQATETPTLGTDEASGHLLKQLGVAYAGIDRKLPLVVDRHLLIVLVQAPMAMVVADLAYLAPGKVRILVRSELTGGEDGVVGTGAVGGGKELLGETLGRKGLSCEGG